MSTLKISNNTTRARVQQRVAFQGNNMFAREKHVVQSETTLYIVYSYGEHFPIYAAETDAQGTTHWYVNTDKYSPSTTRHQSQANPYVPCIPMDTDRMKHIARGGLMELVARGLA